MTPELVSEPGTIITFYSYKGGTGRSMALANVACLLRQELGDSIQRICVMDWDLEAPGLHRYFPASDLPENLDRWGVIDYFARLREALSNSPELYERLQQPEGWRILEEHLPLSDYVVTNVADRVDLIKAGRFGDQYADRVASFDWADFYRKYREMYGVFRELLTQRYRWCLIDSRTGLSDVTGVCTMLMPEKLVAAFTPNRQSLEGLLDLVEKAVEYRRRSSDPRSLAVFPLPSRIVTEEHDLQKQAHDGYQSKFERCFARAYGIEQCDLSSYFEEVAIPHKGFYGFGEKVAVRDDPSTTDALSVNRAYERFYQRLVRLDCAWDSTLDAALIQQPSPGFSDRRRGRTTRPVLRVFISSTAVNLRDYREKVRDAVLRLEDIPIAMETFSAQSAQSASECMQMAAEADAVICIVAHRYGYVPPADLGGDGERSITWLEVDAAKRAGTPVFAFVVDPKAPWTEIREQDRLTSEPPEKILEIVRAVQKLQEFKAYLERECARQTFTSPEDLATHVAIAVANFTTQRGRAPVSAARVWRPLFCHALQPAQHFRGRKVKLQELKDWLQAPVTPDRVVSVVAAGGAGKTALVHQALHEATLSDRAGVFVWSFYEDPHTDSFLRAAYVYFTGEKDAPPGAMLERLQLALSGDAPHVLILDGLERVQSEGGTHRRGEVEDLQLKRLMRSLAGGVGSARALVTSRFPLVDLDGFTGAGYRAIVLDDLEHPVALEVLRAWGVRGDDAALAQLIEPLNVGELYHALSVAALGSYLGNFAGGDPSRAPQFSLGDATESDPKARRLSRILEQYAKALTAAERDLLARLSLFPRGVKVELLGWIVQSGGEVAGALTGLADYQLVKHLEKLKALGLVYRYETDGQIIYSAHPFLRDFFRNLLGTRPESFHELVRARLARSLDARPKIKPEHPIILDQYELLIEQTLLAGRVQEAFDLYHYGLGEYRNLGRVLGENGRGLRILEGFVPRDQFSRIEPHLRLSDRSALMDDLGLFAKSLGDLARARDAFRQSRDLSRSASDPKAESVSVQNLAALELDAGHPREALECSERAVSLASEANDEAGTKQSVVVRATAHFAFGDITAASAGFQRATEPLGKPLNSYAGVLEAECKILRGDRRGALIQTQANLEFAVTNNYNDILCRSNALLARLLLPDNPAQAAQYLQDARAFASHSGEVNLQLRCFHSACELYRHLGDYPQAIAEAEAGILLADTCGFGRYSIDLRLALAETLLAAGDARKALQNARNALDRSEHLDCQYAWGKADGLHFCGLAHLWLGERELARQRLTAALEIRERLGHGRVEETRRALASCQQ